MFEVGDVLVYTDGKIYEIVDLVERDFGVGIQQYYQLKQNSMSLTKNILLNMTETLSAVLKQD